MCSKIHIDLTNLWQFDVWTQLNHPKLRKPPSNTNRHRPTRCLRRAIHHCLPKPLTPATTKKSTSSISDATHSRSPPVVVPPAYFCVPTAANAFETRLRRWNGHNPTRRRWVMMFFSFECSEIHINLTIASQAHLQRLGLALNCANTLFICYVYR